MPEFPEIVAAAQSPLITLGSHRIGGSGKSLGGQIIVDAAHRSALNFSVFENDSQTFYDPYGAVNHILLAPADELVHDPIADVRVHTVFDRALLNAAPNDCLVYDCAAASINRHTFVVDQLDIGLRVEAMGRHVLVLVPTSARDDIARDALESYSVWRELLGHPHRVVPMVSQRDGDIRRLNKGHDLYKLLEIAEDGVFIIPRVPMTVINDIRRSGMKLCDLADTRNPLATADMAKKMGMDPTIVQMMRRVAGTLLSQSDDQVRRLGFTLGL